MHASRLHALLLLLASVAIPSPADDSPLPTGPGTPALAAPYFPDRVHEFIFRNWALIPPAKLAATIGASEPDVAVIATAMGLPPVTTVQPEIRERGYVSLIRRNWHLLPYDQLLQLLDMTPDHLATMLREEDFLWIKLGSVKPACEPLRYAPPSEAAKQREAEIRAVLENDFADALTKPGEPRFDFVRQLSAPLPDFASPAPGQPDFLRIVYSYVALYGDPLLNAKLDPYPDGLLQRLSNAGINGVWLQAVLRDLAPGGDAFPEFGKNADTRLANLRALVERARKSGVGIYLYINEPRAMPSAFFKDRPDLAGVKENDYNALCTSQPAVRKWMSDALTHIFREVPGLAGVYAITASENLTNCASHGAWQSCPHCKDRTDADILVEVVNAVEEGVHRGNPDAHVLISDWGWRGHGDAREFIPRLPKSIYLMSVSEWSLPIERGGIKSTVGEYAISAVGPGPRALPHWTTASQSGMKSGAEIQFNNTCEIASIPYLPVLDLVAEHCSNLLNAAKLNAMFIGWTMGGHPSPNIKLAARLNQSPPPSVETALDELARERFGAEGATHARKAWKLASDAFREYPFHISVVYTCPVQWGPANPVYAIKTNYSATMWGLPYDDLKGWCGPYPPDVFASQFAKVATGWKPALDELRLAVELTPTDRRAEAASDLRYARAAGIHFAAVANQTRFTIARNALAQTPPPNAETSNKLRGEMRSALESEITLARELYTLCQEDSRIGFEPSCQYFYLPQDLIEKVVNCRWQLTQLSN